MTKDNLKTAISLYLEHRPQMLEASLQGSDEPYDHRARGSSRPPTTNRGLAWMDDALSFTNHGEACGRHETLKLTSVLNSVCESYRLGRESHRPTGLPYSDVMNLVWEDPSAVRWMQNATSENARSYRDAFRALAGRIAGEFSQMYPEVEMYVSLTERDTRARPKTAEAYRAQRKITAEDSYRGIVRRVEAYEGAGMSREEAKDKVRWELDCGKTRINDAVAFVKWERSKSDGAA